MFVLCTSLGIFMVILLFLNTDISVYFLHYVCYAYNGYNKEIHAAYIRPLCSGEVDNFTNSENAVYQKLCYKSADF